MNFYASLFLRFVFFFVRERVSFSFLHSKVARFFPACLLQVLFFILSFYADVFFSCSFLIPFPEWR